MDFYERVKTLAKSRGTTIEAVVKCAGLTRGSYNTYRRRELLPRANEAMIIAKELGTTVEYLLSGENVPAVLQKTITTNETAITNDSASNNAPTDGFSQRPILKLVRQSEVDSSQFRIPLLNQKASAGFGSTPFDGDEYRSFIPAPQWLARFGKDTAALMVVGDSMEPTLENGDLIVCDTYGWSYEGIYVLQLGDHIFVKRVQRLPKIFRIISDNTRYPVMEEPIESQDLRIIGLIRCVVRKVN